MSSALETRLPGIYFDARVPDAREVLPRMDIAGFVGFAAAGPVGVPVAIEDVRHFESIFGGELRLAWDRRTGAYATAHLLAAVRAFFANGGRRCWVVRVAAGAVANRFIMPGLLQVGPAPTCALDGVQLVARSEGTWSDAVSANASIELERLPPVRAVRSSDGHYGLRFEASVAGRVRTGDLLEVRRVGGGDEVLYFPVAAVASEPRVAALELARAYEPAPGGDAAVTTVVSKAGTAQWFAPWRPPAPLPGVVANALTVNATWLNGGDGRTLPLAIDGMRVWTPFEPPRLALRIARADGAGLAPGSFLRALLTGTNGPEEVLFLLRSLSSAPQASPGLAGARSSPVLATGVVADAAGDELWLDAQAFVRLSAEQAWSAWMMAAQTSPVREGPAQAALVRLQLHTRAGGRPMPRLTGLGLCSGHARALHDLPSDAELFARRDTPAPAAGAPLRAELMQRQERFALAAAGVPSAAVFLPLGLTGVAEEGLYAAAVDPALPSSAVGVASRRPALERDGLARFDAVLFVDARFMAGGPDGSASQVRADRLLQRAFEISNPAIGAALPLQGMHALLELDEVTVLALPDAGHLGFETAATTEAWVPASPLVAVEVSDVDYSDRRTWQLRFAAVLGAEGYVLECASDPRFEGATRIEPSPAFLATLPGDHATVTLARPPPEAPLTFYRLYAYTGERRGPASNTVFVIARGAGFVACDLEPLPAPVLDERPALGRRVLSWRWTGAGPARYRIEVARDAAFESARLLATGDASGAPEVAVWPPADGAAYYRVGIDVGASVDAKVGGRQSPWSNAVAIGASVEPVRAVVAESDRDAPSPTLLAVHAAALRMCAARGDMFAVLALGAQTDVPGSIAHQTALAQRLRAADEVQALAYGALFGPWLLDASSTHDQLAPARPPEGAVAGLLAARSLAAGPWLSIANLPLSQAVGLTATLAAQAQRQLLAARINPLRQDPRGILLVDAQTLSSDPELGPVGVRRLLSQLRKLALRHGNAHVFEPNSQAFRRKVQRHFEALLGQMHQRGAFANARPEQAFVVVVDASINPPSSLKLGRFFVELRVAPSQPLAFLVVRLVQETAEGLRVSEGSR